MNCKPGDLAYVRECPYFPENIGIIVTVLHADSPSGLGACWVVQTPRPVAVCGDTEAGITELVLATIVSSVPDSWLVPITGEPLNETDLRDEPIEEVV